MYDDDQTRLRHMLDATKEALTFASGQTREDVGNNRVLVLALTKCIEIIGEAASRVSPQYRADHPQIPWQDVIAMRNRLIHGYFSIDVDIVWNTVVHDLPPLLVALEKIVSESG